MIYICTLKDIMDLFIMDDKIYVYQFQENVRYRFYSIKDDRLIKEPEFTYVIPEIRYMDEKDYFNMYTYDELEVYLRNMVEKMVLNKLILTI